MHRLARSSCLALLAWAISYIGFGYLSIQLTELAPKSLALLWLPAGIGLLMYCRYGKRALPWIFCASFAVNGYYSLLSTDQQILYLQFNVQDIGSLSEGLTELGNSLVSSILASLIDCFEAWLGFRIWRIPGKIWARWSQPMLLRFTWMCCTVPFISAALQGVVFIAQRRQLTASDSELNWLCYILTQGLNNTLGMFLLVPLLYTLMLQQYRGLQVKWVHYSAWLLLPFPLLLAIYHPIFSVLIFVCSVWLVLQFRYLGATACVFLLGLQGLTLSSHNLLFHALSVDSHRLAYWAILIISIGLPLLMLGQMQEENLANRTLMQWRINHKTQALKHALRRTAKLASEDPLTQLYNRGWAQKHLETLWPQYHATAGKLCLLFIDIDHFKKINDHFGHHHGDQVLATIATLLRKHMPDIAMIARWGGEEFIIALHSYPLQHIEQQAKRLCQQIALHPFAHGEPVTVSIGIVANRTAESLSSALNRADQAMYRAKQQGRNQVVSCPMLA